MDLVKIIEERKSIRAFKADPVPEDLVRQILAAAAQAPSAINLQPWEFLVVAGEERKRLSRRLLKAYREKNISCSPGNVKPLASAFTSRGVQSFEGMKPYLEEMGSEFNRFGAAATDRRVAPGARGQSCHRSRRWICRR